MDKVSKTVMLLMVGLVLVTSGCFSAMTYDGSKERVIEAKRLANDGVGVAVDIADPNFLETIKERPFLQLGAALLDAGILYGSYEGLKAIEDGLDDSDDDLDTISVAVDGEDNEVNVLVINGNDNDSNADRESSN